MNEESYTRNVNKNEQQVAFKIIEKRCFKCNSSGHLARSCGKSKNLVKSAKVKSCLKCDNDFYLAKDCSRNKNNPSCCSTCNKDNHTQRDLFSLKWKTSCLLSFSKV